MILDDLAEYARVRVARAKQIKSLDQLQAEARSLVHRERTGERATSIPRFSDALATDQLSFICEIKRASPSKGLIAPDFPYIDIAQAYQAAGADCISCLTEPKWFLGSDEIFAEVRAAQNRPMIRKDFTVDPYQVYEAKVMGAQAVLLICSLLDTRQLESYLALCDELGLDALVEAHDASEIASAVTAGAHIIGVNNRNLKDFSVDFENAQRLRDCIPPNVLYVAESGVKTAADIAQVAALGADAVLVGEALMRASDKAALLTEFRQAAQVGAARRIGAAQTDKPCAQKEQADGSCAQAAQAGTVRAGATHTQEGQADAAQASKACVPATQGSVCAQAKLKFCGISHPDDARAANAIKPDYVGLVLWPASKRVVSVAEARALRNIIDPSIACVGVFVDENVERVAHCVEEGIIQVVQLHGSEDERYLEQLRSRVPQVEIWQAYIVNDLNDVARAQQSSADCVVVDGGKGDGKAFQWELLRNLKRPFVLAGGLTCENAQEALRTVHPFVIDVSSGIECDTRAPDGRTRKDSQKMRAFKQAVQNASH